MEYDGPSYGGSEIYKDSSPRGLDPYGDEAISWEEFKRIYGGPVIFIGGMLLFGIFFGI